MAMTGTFRECTAASRVAPDPRPRCRRLSDTSRNSWLLELSSVPSKRPDTQQRSQVSEVVPVFPPSPLFCARWGSLQRTSCGPSSGTKALHPRTHGLLSAASPASPSGTPRVPASAQVSGEWVCWFPQRTSTCRRTCPWSPRTSPGAGEGAHLPRVPPRSFSLVRSRISVSAPA